MSEITEDLKQQLKGNYGAGFLQDALTNLYSGSNVSRNDRGGVDLHGAAWWLQGLAPNAHKVAEQNLDLRDSKNLDKAVAGTRFTRAELAEAVGGNLTNDNVAQAASRLVKDEDDDRVETLRTQAVEDRNEGFKHSNEQLAAQNTFSTNQLAAQLASADKKFLLQMADSADQRAADTRLQMAQFQMQMDREDRRERRADKKDRQAALMQMMQGLSQMGASIAI